MESLLRWSIANSAPPAEGAEQQPRPAPQALDPGIIDHILGRPDSELMKEDVQAATDATKSDDERVDAWDHLEMVRRMLAAIGDACADWGPCIAHRAD